MLFIFHVQCYSKSLISRLLWLTLLSFNMSISYIYYLYFYLFVFENNELLFIRRDIRLIIRNPVLIKPTVLHSVLPVILQFIKD
jgi:hypothetical protein